MVRSLLSCAALLIVGLPLHAQVAKDFLRNNPKFLQNFRGAVGQHTDSTVRVACDGNDTALGVVIDTDGLILTKACDLKGHITCSLKSGQVHAAKIVGIEERHDLALLRIDAKGLKAIAFAPSKEIVAGSWIASVGIGADPIAVGVVSVATRTLTLKANPLELIDPAKAAYLGVSMEPAEPGVRVTQVQPSSAAANAGLKADDVLLKLNGKQIEGPEFFLREMIQRRAGDKIKIQYKRGDETKEVEAILQLRPKGGNFRAEFQNRMGSELSTRRSGYPTFLQHDTILKPTDCGGPLVDLDGKVIGVNICRAGRVESWAIPTEIILAVLPDLKSGKLAPKHPESSKAIGDEWVDELLVAMRDRLALMPDVALAKWIAKKDVADPEREKVLLAQLVKQGAKLGLSDTEVTALIRSQFQASRRVQESLHKAWADSKKEVSGSPKANLAALRPQIEKQSIAVLAAFAKARPHLGHVDELPKRVDAIITGTGVDAETRAILLKGLQSALELK